MGGCVRDLLRGVEPADWDLTTNARPEQVVALFPDALYENRFGTVDDRRRRRDVRGHDLPARRRRTRIIGGRTRWSSASARRRPGPTRLHGERDGARHRRGAADRSRPGRSTDGAANSASTPPRSTTRSAAGPTSRAGILRAVGDPATRFREDALRMLRAVRFAATLGFGIEPRTLAAIAENAALARSLSGERVLAELHHAAGRPGAVGRAAAGAGDRPAGGDRPRARPPAGRAAGQGARRGPLGPHLPDRRRRARDPAPTNRRCCAWRPSSTTSASRRRSRTAISWATRRSARRSRRPGSPSSMPRAS